MCVNSEPVVTQECNYLLQMTVVTTLFNDNFEGTTSAKFRNLGIPVIILWFLVIVFAILLCMPSSEVQSKVAVSAHLRDVGVMFG